MAEANTEIYFVAPSGTGRSTSLIDMGVGIVGKAAHSRALGERDALGLAIYEAGGVVTPPFNLDMLAEICDRTDAVSACIEHRVASTVGMGFDFVPKLQPRSGSDITHGESIEGDPQEREKLRAVFEVPNERGEFALDVLRDVYSDELGLGIGYTEITRDDTNEISGLYYLPSRTMRIRTDKNGKMNGFVQDINGRQQHFRVFGFDKHKRFTVLQRVGLERPEGADDAQWRAVEKAGVWLPGECYKDTEAANKAVAKANGNGAVSKLTEVIHLKRRGRRRGLYGIPALAACVEDAIALANMKLWNADYFENGTIPPAIVLIRGGTLAEETRVQLKSYLENESRQEFHRLAMISTPFEEVTIEVIHLTQAARDDMGFVMGQEKSHSNIAMAYRVPFSMIAERMQSGRPGQSEQDMIRFREQVVRPDQRRLCMYVNGLILADMGINTWEFKLLEGDLTELTAKAAAAERSARGGWISPDEYRSVVHDFPPLAEGAGKEPFSKIPGVGPVRTKDVATGEWRMQRIGGSPGKQPDADELKETIKEEAEKAGYDLDDDSLDDVLNQILESV